MTGIGDAARLAARVRRRGAFRERITGPGDFFGAGPELDRAAISTCFCLGGLLTIDDRVSVLPDHSRWPFRTIFVSCATLPSKTPPTSASPNTRIVFRNMPLLVQLFTGLRLARVILPPSLGALDDALPHAPVPTPRRSGSGCSGPRVSPNKRRRYQFPLAARQKLAVDSRLGGVYI